MSELSERLAKLDAEMTRRPWKLWGGEVRALLPGIPDDEVALEYTELVADVPLKRNENGRGSHVKDAYAIAELRNLLPRLIAAEAERERLREACEWRDIATAPKDGTLVLVYSESDGPRTARIHVNIHNGQLQWRDSDQYTFQQPTHWLSLPQPPSDAAHAALPAE